jgi:aminoglycoside phosphotransferase (APT) family kinase protein
MSRDAFERVVARLDPRAKLLRHWALKGGLSAEVTALEIRRGAGTTATVIVRRHGELDRMRNPNIAADEFRLLQYLQPLDVAAPIPVHLDTSCTIFPTPYLVMDYVDGAVDLQGGPADAHLAAMARQLARIHRIDDSTETLAFLPPAARIIQWLLDHRPAVPDRSMSERRIRAVLEAAWPWPQHNRSVLLHGDFWPGNIVWRGDALAAVIDWEDAERGDPLRDLGITRLDLLWAYGENAMDAFTRHYQSLAPIDMTNLPLWDLCAALRPAGRLAEWAGDPSRLPQMLDRHALFIDRAFVELS